MTIFIPDLIRTNVMVKDKEECLTQMTELLYVQKAIYNLEKFKTEIFKREEAFSTGIGRGIALPHAVTETAYELKALVYVLDKEIDFQSVDAVQVKLVIMLAVPVKESSLRLKLLAALSKKFSEETILNRVKYSNDRELVLQIFKELENEI
ncbi:MAG: PTS sugar transporter subunit IIA [Candidatus Cloacimonetes bacterium]|nr:PTS sugar transporter subunit IIA [Candidatus Cloacimonadota bacterium]